MHFETPIQVYIEQDIISTTVRTRNDEKILEKILTLTVFEPASPWLSRPGRIVSRSYCYTYDIVPLFIRFLFSLFILII